MLFLHESVLNCIYIVVKKSKFYFKALQPDPYCGSGKNSGFSN